MLTPDVCALQNEVGRLRALLSDSSAMLPTEWKLTPAEERIFRALLASDCASVATIQEVAATNAQAARVHLHRIRKKLSPRGVEIETLHGRGWRLVGREQWARILAPKPIEGVQ